MDYSSLPNDPDLPAGTSPWQSSPQRPTRRSDSTSEAGSVPSSPLVRHSPYRPEPQLQSDSTDDQETLAGGVRALGSERERDLSAPAQNGSAEETPEGEPSLRTNEQDFQERQRYSQVRHDRQPQQQQQQQQQQRATGPNRYHPGARSTARQGLPQYKLQAKVTGLERTGRKDPAVRFDVHVSSTFHASGCGL